MKQFRFKISQKDQNDSFTEWVEETKVTGLHSNAVDAIEQVALDYPEAAVSIERRVKPKDDNPKP